MLVSQGLFIPLYTMWLTMVGTMTTQVSILLYLLESQLVTLKELLQVFIFNIIHYHELNGLPPRMTIILGNCYCAPGAQLCRSTSTAVIGAG